MGRSRGAREEDHAPSGGSRPNRCRYATTNQSAAAMPPQAGRTPWGASLHGRILTVPNPHHQDTMSFPLVREDWSADEEMLLLEFLRAADGQDAPETPLGRAAGEQRGERQRAGDCGRDGMCWRARPLAFERAGDCGLEIGSRDEESRATGALTAAANVQTGTDGERCEEQAIGDASNGNRVNGDNVTDGLEIGSSMPRGEANVASVAMAATVEIEVRRDVPHNGSPACRHAPPLNGDEGNAPGAPQPPRRSARRTPCAQAPVRAADPRSGAGSDQQQPAEQQGRSRQDAQEEVDEERVRSPQNIRGQERQVDPLDQREGGARSASGRRGGGRTADRGGRAAGPGERARGGGPENVYLQALEMYGMGNWGEIAEHVGCKSSMAQLPASPLQCSSLSPPASCPSPPCTHQALEMRSVTITTCPFEAPQKTTCSRPVGQDLSCLRTQADTEAAKAAMEEQEAAETANLSPTRIFLLRAPNLVPLPFSLQDLSRLRTQADTEAAKAAMQEQEAAETNLTRLRTQADTEAAKVTMEEQEADETANLSPTLISLLRAPVPVPLPLSLSRIDLTCARKHTRKQPRRQWRSRRQQRLLSTSNPPHPLYCRPSCIAASLQDLTRLRTQADTEAAKAAMEEQEAAETAARAQEAVLFSVPVVKPEPGTKADDAAAPITSGYNTKRNEFDPEYDNEAEAPLAELKIKDSDSSVDRQLKIKMLHIYYSRCVGFG
ncbi:unnamed protein product [Closterium sp. NIES-65]|nr:unnamed protein product [Closterium sp. NIES-65]